MFVIQVQRVYFEVGTECNVNALQDVHNMPRALSALRPPQLGAVRWGTKLGHRIYKFFQYQQMHSATGSYMFRHNCCHIYC